jgi:hypothetical protein
MKKIIFILIILINFFTYSQVKEENYQSFSESNSREHLLYFVNDSIVKISSIRTHMSGQVSLTAKFHKINDNIEIKISKFTKKDSIEFLKFQLSYLDNKIIKLYLNKTELIDIENKTVYVKNSIYSKNYYQRKSLSYFEGKKYIIEKGIINGYGIIEKIPKANKKFTKVLQKQLDNPESYTSTIYRGLTAYNKFGRIGINGVCVTEKK